jgi:F-type H+-transporting ATPase subunit b
MLIDWFTVGAQVVNFAVLVWLMKRFLYRPVLNAIEKRRREIASALAEAEADKEEARREREEYRRKNEELERQRTALLEGARQEAGEERARLLDEARGDVEELRASHREALRLEMQQQEDEIASLVRAEVLAIVDKALADLAGSSLDQRIGEVFCRRLRELDAGTREKLSVVRSAFRISDTVQKKLLETLSEFVPAEVVFLTDPDMVGGFEIMFGERKLSWNIASYLEGLRGRIDEMLPKKEGACAPARSEASP